MRFVPAACLKSGMILGQDLYGNKNELLLSEGQVLTDSEVERIRILKYQGAYIIDVFSQDISSHGLISSSLKNNTVRAIKEVFNQVKSDDTTGPIPSISGIKLLINDIVDEITTNQNASVNMLDLKVFDDYTYYHCVNVAALSIVVGAASGLTKTDLYQLGLGSLLHDIGKVFVPKDLLEKKGKLSDEEFQEIQKHSLYGSEYLRNKWEIPIESNLVVLSHHEKYDGTGYPYKLGKDKISTFGKIAAVADVYDALTSDRPYRKAMPPSEAMEYVMGGSGTLFDPKVVSMFTRKVAPYPIGTCVMLSNGLTGIVIENYDNCGMRPKIRIISESHRNEIYDLYNDFSLLNVTITAIAEI